MNVDYWLPDSEERNHKLSDIPSPTDMAKAIERVRALHQDNGAGMCAECMPDGAIRLPCSTIKVLEDAR